MENVHGVDVSWCHRSTNGIDHNAFTPLANSPKAHPAHFNPFDVGNVPPPPKKAADTRVAIEKVQSVESTAPATPQPIPKQSSKRPGLLSRSTSDKNDKSEKSPKRTSWMSNLGQKLSSRNTPPPAAPVRQPSETLQKKPNDSVKPEEESVDIPQSPKGNSSFFTSRLRRLSSGSLPGNAASATQEGPPCKRRVLNIDEGRERCSVPSLNPAKLRRVAFSVDVEIAGSSRYPAEGEEVDAATKKKEKKTIERDEGEALRRPSAALDEKDNQEEASATPSKSSEDLTSPNETPASKTQEKGAEKTTTTNQRSPEAKPRPDAAPKVDRPTTDPLRIYRRCCQLREAPVLKRISEQLGNKNNINGDIVTCLNLNKSRMQLTDIVCLGDWLAVVPVKTLLIDDANLTDEGLRMILAGLLAAKPQTFVRRKRGRSSPSRLRDNTIVRTPGVIEKLTLRNNRKLTVDAWKYLCVFLNLSKSVLAVDLSLVPFPRDKSQDDVSQILLESLSSRTGGKPLDELLLSECGIGDDDIGKIIEAAVKSELKRLSVAGNPLTKTGLLHLASFLKSDVCKGLDVGGINLHKQMPILTDAIDDKSSLQALATANCNLTADDLVPLLSKSATIPDMRFLDFSHNRRLFSEKPTALPVLRRFLPQMKFLKRIHLIDVGLTTADAIGIVEIVPEMRNIAHLNFMENTELAKVATAADPSLSGEAVSLYMSLGTVVKLSKTMLCIDLEFPDKDANELVKAYADRLVAYCLRNLKSFTEGDAIREADAAAALPDVANADTGMLDVIRGGKGQSNASVDHKDYLVNGEGLVKALNHCLFKEYEATGKMPAREMAKTLLVSAREFREKLKTLLEPQVPTTDYDMQKRLQFLEQTIDTIIERFEIQFPECKRRPKMAPRQPSALEGEEPIDTSVVSPSNPENEGDVQKYPFSGDRQFAIISTPPSPSPSAEHKTPFDSKSPPNPLARTTSHPHTSTTPSHGHGYLTHSGRSSPRRGSATDLASFALASEEAKFLRFGQKVRRDVLPPTGTDDRLHGTSRNDPAEPEYTAQLRRRLEEIGGEEFRSKINAIGWEATFSEIKEERKRLMAMDEQKRRTGSAGSA